MSCHCKKRVTTNNNQQITKSIALTRSLHRSSVRDDDFVLWPEKSALDGQQSTSSGTIRTMSYETRNAYVRVGKTMWAVFELHVRRWAARGWIARYVWRLTCGTPYVTCTTNFTKWCFLSAPIYTYYDRIKELGVNSMYNFKLNRLFS